MLHVHGTWLDTCLDAVADDAEDDGPKQAPPLGATLPVISSRK
jgi:hypothetical protein